VKVGGFFDRLNPRFLFFSSKRCNIIRNDRIRRVGFQNDRKERGLGKGRGKNNVSAVKR